MLFVIIIIIIIILFFFFFFSISFIRLADYLIVNTMHVLAVNSVSTLLNYLTEQLQNTPTLAEIQATMEEKEEDDENKEEEKKEEEIDPAKVLLFSPSLSLFHSLSVYLSI